MTCDAQACRVIEINFKVSVKFAFSFGIVITFCCRLAMFFFLLVACLFAASNVASKIALGKLLCTRSVVWGAAKNT